jgi:hypothetical protein
MDPRGFREDLGPRAFLQLVSGSLALLWANLWGFAQIELAIAALACMFEPLEPHMDAASTSFPLGGAGWLYWLLSLLLAGTARVVRTAATVTAVERKAVSVVGAVRRAWKARWPLLLLTAVYTLPAVSLVELGRVSWWVLLLSMPFIGVLGFMLVLRRLCFPALFAETLSAREALERGRRLLNDAEERLVIPGAIVLLCMWAAFHAVPPKNERLFAWLGILGSGVLSPIEAAFLTLLYYDQRLRREGLASSPAPIQLPTSPIP